ncbi:MAG: hypothetical protein VX726_08030 [Planctomycetota bacterium]|nr:hypothetical protein [Planctomycetota bacterium]
MRNPTLVGSGLAMVVSTAALADITGAYVVSYEATAEDFGGVSTTVFVQDLYLSSNNDADVALNVYNMKFDGATNSASSYYQSQTSTGWKLQNAGGFFDYAALREIDSFVTIGGVDQDTLRPEQLEGQGGDIGLDPNFGGNNAVAPGELAGWYNGNPENLAGQVGQVAAAANDGTFALGVMVGRFATTEFASLEGATFEVTWNQGLGTGGVQQTFTITPAPGALALLGLAGIAGRRRRG